MLTWPINFWDRPCDQSSAVASFQGTKAHHPGRADDGVHLLHPCEQSLQRCGSLMSTCSGESARDAATTSAVPSSAATTALPSSPEAPITSTLFFASPFTSLASSVGGSLGPLLSSWCRRPPRAWHPGRSCAWSAWLLMARSARAGSGPQQLAQRSARNHLPRDAVPILQPTAHAGFAAVGQQRIPVVVDLVLIGAVDEERDGLRLREPGRR